MRVKNFIFIQLFSFTHILSAYLAIAHRSHAPYVCRCDWLDSFDALLKPEGRFWWAARQSICGLRLPEAQTANIWVTVMNDRTGWTIMSATLENNKEEEEERAKQGQINKIRVSASAELWWPDHTDLRQRKVERLLCHHVISLGVKFTLTWVFVCLSIRQVWIRHGISSKRPFLLKE